MEQLKPLPEELIEQLKAHCLPFREEFFQLRTDGGEKHAPITSPVHQLTMSGLTLAYSTPACQQWQMLERFLSQFCATKPNPVVVGGNQIGRSFASRLMMETLAHLAIPMVTPPRPIRQPPGGHYEVDHRRFDFLSGRFGRSFREESRFRDYSYVWPVREYEEPSHLNTTDYIVPRGGKRIPHQVKCSAAPSERLLALLSRSQT